MRTAAHAGARCTMVLASHFTRFEQTRAACGRGVEEVFRRFHGMSPSSSHTHVHTDCVTVPLESIGGGVEEGFRRFHGMSMSSSYTHVVHTHVIQS